jgi:late competence protein required for DNA uptake (superfamily II DNA/RNA helicase)
VTGALSQQRCWTHAQREAVSRCPACARFYCRECVTEHGGRLLCRACLAVNSAPETKIEGTRWLGWMLAALAGMALSFLLHGILGYALRQLPPSWTQGVE